MIVAPLMDPILSLAFGLSIADNRLVKRSAITVIIDMVLNVPTKLVGKLGLEEVQDNMRRRAMNDYGIKEVEINFSVIPTQILRYSPEAAPTP